MLSFCAAGKWVLVPQFLSDSHVAGNWLKEETYEWCSDWEHEVPKETRKHLLRAELINRLSTPKRCRLQVIRKGQLRFKDWIVLNLIETESQRESFSRILCAGGAIVSEIETDDFSAFTHVFKNNLESGFSIDTKFKDPVFLLNELSSQDTDVPNSIDDNLLKRKVEDTFSSDATTKKSRKKNSTELGNSSVEICEAELSDNDLTENNTRDFFTYWMKTISTAGSNKNDCTIDCIFISLESSRLEWSFDDNVLLPLLSQLTYLFSGKPLKENFRFISKILKNHELLINCHKLYQEKLAEWKGEHPTEVNEDKCKIKEKNHRYLMTCYKFYHLNFLSKVFNDIIPNFCTDDIYEIFCVCDEHHSGSTFISKLIKACILDKKNSLAFDHLKIVVKAININFHQFLQSTEESLSTTISKSLIAKIAWPKGKPDSKSPFVKDLIMSMVRVSKDRGYIRLLQQLCHLFELINECLRIIYGNVRPGLHYCKNIITPVGLLYQRLIESSNNDENSIKINRVRSCLSLSWIKCQLSLLSLIDLLYIKDEMPSNVKYRITLQFIILCLIRRNPKEYMSFIHKTDTSVNTSDCNVVMKQKHLVNEMIQALSNIDLKSFRTCLKNEDVDPNLVSEFGRSVIIEATICGSSDFLEELIKWKILNRKTLNFKLKSSEGLTALHYAVKLDHLNCAKLILNYGGLELLHLKCYQGFTPDQMIKTEEMRNLVEEHRKVKNPLLTEIEATATILSLHELLTSYFEINHTIHFSSLSESMWHENFKSCFGRNPRKRDLEVIKDDVENLKLLKYAFISLKESLQINQRIEHSLDFVSKTILTLFDE